MLVVELDWFARERQIFHREVAGSRLDFFLGGGGKFFSLKKFKFSRGNTEFYRIELIVLGAKRKIVNFLRRFSCLFFGEKKNPGKLQKFCVASGNCTQAAGFAFISGKTGRVRS